MKQLFFTIAIALSFAWCVAIGNLALPSVANAAACPTFTAANGASNFYIAETTAFGSGEDFSCTIPAFTGFQSLGVVLNEPTNQSQPSDNFVTSQATPSSDILVSLTSDTEGALLPPPPSTTVVSGPFPEETIACPSPTLGTSCFGLAGLGVGGARM